MGAGTRSFHSQSTLSLAGIFLCTLRLVISFVASLFSLGGGTVIHSAHGTECHALDGGSWASFTQDWKGRQACLLGSLLVLFLFLHTLAILSLLDWVINEGFISAFRLHKHSAQVDPKCEHLF